MAVQESKAFPQVDFIGGLNLTDNSNLIADNEMSDGYNFDIDVKGKLTRRLGYGLWTDPGLSNKKCYGSVWVNFSNGDHKNFQIRAVGSNCYVYDIAEGSATLLEDNNGVPYQLSIAKVYFTQFNDVVFCSNGVDDNFEIVLDHDAGVYVVRKLGIATPTTAPTLALGG